MLKSIDKEIMIAAENSVQQRLYSCLGLGTVCGAGVTYIQPAATLPGLPGTLASTQPRLASWQGDGDTWGHQPWAASSFKKLYPLHL